MESFMSRKEVAAIIGVAPQTLARWAWAGGGPNYVRIGKMAKYRREDVAKWVEMKSRPTRHASHSISERTVAFPLPSRNQEDFTVRVQFHRDGLVQEARHVGGRFGLWKTVE